ncbi:MAG TPA: LEA type 2 family protein [Phycisphaerales bacterium]|nr:LEA type 2 family protein [Phycisphaerales bacterium]
MRTLALCSLLLLLPGCSIVREAANFEPPQMELTKAATDTLSQGPARDASFVVVRFEVLAQNPNAKPVPMQLVAYSVESAGQTLFTGTRDAQRTIPPFGAMRFDLPATIPAEFATQPLTLRSAVGYRKPGALADTLYGLDLVKPVLPVIGTTNPQ